MRNVPHEPSGTLRATATSSVSRSLHPPPVAAAPSVRWVAVGPGGRPARQGCRAEAAGAAVAASTVTVYDQTANTTSGPLTRAGQYFFRGHTMDNSTGAVAHNLTINAPGSLPAASETTAFLSAGTSGFAYDADGNLTDDGRWAIFYDAENRPTWMESSGAAVDEPTSQP